MITKHAQFSEKDVTDAWAAFLNFDWVLMERERKRYWKEVRLGNAKVLRQLENDIAHVESLNQYFQGVYEGAIQPEFRRKQLKTIGRFCVSCNGPLSDRDTGRPLLYCSECFKKQRKIYQHAKYLERKALNNVILTTLTSEKKTKLTC